MREVRFVGEKTIGELHDGEHRLQTSACPSVASGQTHSRFQLDKRWPAKVEAAFDVTTSPIFGERHNFALDATEGQADVWQAVLAT